MSMIMTDDLRRMAANAKIADDMKCGVGCVLLRPDGKMWCQIRSDTKQIATPGGKVEKGESPLMAVKREVLEEMGITLRSVFLYGIQSHTSPTGSWMSFLFVSDDFDDTGAKKQTSEVDDMFIMTLGEFNTLPEDRVFPPSRVGMDELTDCGGYVFSTDTGGYERSAYAQERMIPYAECPDTPTGVSDSCMCAYSINPLF